MSYYSDLIENATTIPVALGPYPSYSAVIAFQVGPLSINSGQLVEVHFQAEVTNDKSYTVLGGRYVTLEQNSTNTGGYRLLVVPCYEEITPAQHHRAYTHSVLWQATTGYSNCYVTAVVFAISSSAGSSDTIPLEQGYGFLTVEVR